jgi:hypothetical protein
VAAFVAGHGGFAMDVIAWRPFVQEFSPEASGLIVRS